MKKLERVYFQDPKPEGPKKKFEDFFEKDYLPEIIEEDIDKFYFPYK